jgi:hypothetical protein
MPDIHVPYVSSTELNENKFIIFGINTIYLLYN